ncbi:pentatricopeptide repeat-containing protein At2g36240 [Oryza brachyantha]|uniref:Pentacotripeptide-repeat region of PRORP domain-containing protein n=1 Tax=Oryza brachyantha TaxID=4533 RepID=J3L6Y8_ORYBR|nr:pentatricopeptide repeat-containing protein At2g36240 [Oryza brachyantha]XP_015693391.1 pentatricopeptide repeat-containing protein At2g36240 [Oryza brachyantha]XP_015693392.1 pentatricopeptide repeat-containing protein At2g36240 [Oryza brachyantha]XP_015693393.1 pentatricopeptide repeat-containing protein At2g36240 [Oryza brachyantha]XP_040376170.1 pentatricopeptide repeat-containing protein At2g36240 [Oryza brachyantha]
MAASRRLARKLPSLISKHQRLITPEVDVQEDAESPASSSIPLDPSLPILPLAVSHLSPPSPLPALPSAHASTPEALLRILRHARHHPRLAALDLHLLLAAASDSPAFRPDHRLTSLLAARLADSRRLPSLRRLLELVLSRPCPCTDDSIFACPELLPTFRKAILAFAASGDIPAASDALASLRRAADSPLPAEFYNIILHALARLRRHEDTIRFYGEMTSTHRVPPDVYTFNILINSSCRAEGVDAAMRWFQEMRRCCCQPTNVSFNTLMRGFFREGRYKEGIKVAREMLQLGFGLSVASMEILIHGLCHGGEALIAAEFFVEFLVDGVVPEGFDCLNLVQSLCRARRLEKAVELVELILERNMLSCLSVPAGVTVLESVVKEGKLDEACRLMARMVAEGIVPDTISCNYIFEALCEARRTVDANRLRLQAKEKGFKADAFTYSILVQGFGRQGIRKEGKAVLDEMLDSGFVPNITAYNRLLDGLHMGRDRRSLQLQEKCSRHGDAAS